MNNMSLRYFANGLAVSSSFPLAGMPADNGRAGPQLRVQRVSGSELRGAWTGCDGYPLWRGRLGDGRELTIALGKAGATAFRLRRVRALPLGPGAALGSCAPPAPRA